MNKSITLDRLARMVQERFLDVTVRMDKMDKRMDSLATRDDLQTLVSRVDALEKRVDLLEERMENGFYNVMRELQDIRKLINKTNTREQVAALEKRVDIVERKIGSNSR